MPIYKNANGKGYRVRINYTDEYGNHKTIERCNNKTQTLKDAKLLEAELLQELNKNPSDVTNENMTFNQLYEEYKKVIFPERRRTTTRQTETGYRLYMKDFFGRKKVFEISANDVVRWKTKIKTEHPEFKIGYLNTLHKNLSKIFNFAMDYYDLNINPAKKAKPFVDPNKFSDIDEFDDIDNDDVSHYWKFEEFMKFYNHINDEIENEKDFIRKIQKSNYLTFYTIAFFAGARKGEIFCLTWDRIRLKNGINQLFIRKSMNQDSIPFEITDPKNRSSIRYVPICDFLQRQLDKHRALYEQVYLFNTSWYICCGHQPIRKTTVNNFKNRYEKILNLPHIRTHGFRHSFATLLINGNINIKTISKLMGHSTVQETWNRYGHLYPEKANEAIEYVNKIIKI